MSKKTAVKRKRIKSKQAAAIAEKPVKSGPRIAQILNPNIDTHGTQANPKQRHV